MEENNKDKDFLLVGADQTFSIITNDNTDFEIDKGHSENIKASLSPNAVAKLAGTFTAKTAGKKILSAVFKYGEGDDATAVTETEVIAVKLVLSLVKPAILPAKLPKNHLQEVEFLLKNETEFEATKVQLEAIEGLTGLVITKEKAKNNDYETVGDKISLVEANKLPQDTLLEAKHQFRIQGKLTTSETGSKIVKILVNYQELEYLDSIDKDKQEAKFEQAIEIQAISVIGTVTTNLPPKIKLGSTQQVVFQFTNQDAEFSATGINITVTQENKIIVLDRGS